MQKPLALAFLVGGLIIFAYGLNASRSFTSGVSKALTGQPTDRAVAFMVAGGILSALGLGALVLRRD